MTPKEKAKELIDRFLFASIYFVNGNEGAKLNSKQCALITVDEMLKNTTWTRDQFERLFKVTTIAEEATTEYWQEVKQEIEKL